MSEPRINSTITSQRQVLADIPQNTLIINQMGASATATSGELIANIPNDPSWESLVGTDSPIAHDIRAFKALNRVSRLDIIPLADVAGTEATGTITFVGTSSSTGRYQVSITSRINHTYEIVADGLTDTLIGDALVTAITADTTSLVTAVNVAGVVTITAKNTGDIGTSYGLDVQGTVPGVAVTVVAMSGGAGNPSLTGIFDVVGNIRYQGIVAPSEYGTSFLTTFLESRFNTPNDILDGVGFMTQIGSLATNEGVLTTLDAKTLVVFNSKLISLSNYAGPNVFEIGDVISSQFAAIRALRLTTGADIASVVVTNQLDDQEGGISLASLPYANTPFVNLPLVDSDKLWSLDEEEQLNAAGGSIFTNNKAGNTLIVSRVRTTYKTDAAGNPDETFAFLNLVDTASRIREFYFDNYKSNYAQTRLSLGDVQPNTAMVNTSSIAAFSVSLYQILGSEGFVLVAAGQDAINFYKNNLDVVIEDLAAGKVRIAMRVQPVSQLRTLVVPIEVVFTV